MSDVQVEGLRDLVRIGSGGLGDVYRAVRTSTGIEVAVKVLRPDDDPQAGLRRINRELAAMASLRGHPHVINLEDVVPSPGGLLALVMEYCPAGSIDERVDAMGATLPLPEVLLVGHHTATGLAAAHEVGVVHRDIKPHNLLIGTYGQVKICDFGIASVTHASDGGTRTNAVSYRFASPEELRGDAEVPASTDVYSLGVTLARLLTNRFFNHETAPHLLDAAVTPGRDDPSDVEMDLRRLLVRCLAHSPDRRPDAATLQRELEALAMRLGPRRLDRLAVTQARRAPSATVTGPPPAAPTPGRRVLHPLWFVAAGLWVAVGALALLR